MTSRLFALVGIVALVLASSTPGTTQAGSATSLLHEVNASCPSNHQCVYLPFVAGPPTPYVVYVVPGGAGTHSGMSWANAQNLQAALSAARPGARLWVKAGTYTPTSGTDRGISFVLKTGVAVYGGFAGTET